MRDAQLMLSLLEEMSTRDSGTLVFVKPSDGHTGEGHRRYHHAELLVDAGHAEWVVDGHHIARITNAGYDFLNVASNQTTGKQATSKFIELFNRGVPYARAAQTVVDWVT